MARGGGGIKSYVIGNAICGAHNVAFMRWYASACVSALCGRRVIKASAQTDKRLSRPPLITRYVIYHRGRARMMQGGRNEFTCTAAPVQLFATLLSRRSS